MVSLTQHEEKINPNCTQVERVEGAQNGQPTVDQMVLIFQNAFSILFTLICALLIIHFHCMQMEIAFQGLIATTPQQLVPILYYF